MKESRFEMRKQLASLGVHVRSIEKWVSQYKLRHRGFVAIEAWRKGFKIITSQVHQGLEARSKDPDNPFKGYWDAWQWVTI